jgi:hypothetical protein
MVIGIPHRGQNFGNLIQLIVMLLQVGLRFDMRCSAHCGGSIVGNTFGRRLSRFRFQPSGPGYSSNAALLETRIACVMLKPSAQYALLYSSNVLAYQLPTLLMQRILGPATVNYLQRDAHCLFDEPSSFISGHQLDWSGDHDYFRPA